VKSTKSIIPLEKLLVSSKILIDEKFANDRDPDSGEKVVSLCVNGHITLIPVGRHFDLDEVLIGTLKDCHIEVSVLGEEDPIEIYGH